MVLTRTRGMVLRVAERKRDALGSAPGYDGVLGTTELRSERRH
jgi:hypothetical protein